MSNKYETAAIANATRGGLDAATVNAYGYQEMATLSDVVLGDGDSSPADFFYENVRNVVVAHLARVAREADKTAQRDSLQTAVRTVEGYGSAIVAENIDGRFEITNILEAHNVIH